MNYIDPTLADWEGVNLRAIRARVGCQCSDWWMLKNSPYTALDYLITGPHHAQRTTLSRACPCWFPVALPYSGPDEPKARSTKRS